MKKNKIAALAGVIMLALALIGCSGKSGETDIKTINVTTEFLTGLGYPPGEETVDLPINAPKGFGIRLVVKSFDFLSEYPNLTSLSLIGCEIDKGLVIPHIASLHYIAIESERAVDLIAENKHIGILNIRWSGENLEPLREFVNLVALTLVDPVNLKDISVLANFKKLSRLDLQNAPVETLSPIYELDALAYVTMSKSVYSHLPIADGVFASKPEAPEFILVEEGEFHDMY
ncbi:MAG: hypothetical protein LBQ91_03555 [Oscillospiraceae bacterium]|jgi:hypothetical protein|nr:hypothetical protein [Oscillospiraceae bacterium]